MATTTSILDGGIMQQAKTYAEARSEFSNQFSEFASRVTPLAPEHFWPMVETFLRVVMEVMRFDRGRVGEAAADEFMRLAAVQTGDISKAVHFALSWRFYKGKAYGAGDKAGFSFERGDDGYGDLMDAMPLMGQVVNRRLCLGEFASLREFNKQIIATCGELGGGMGEKLTQLVLHGENYFAMSLEDAAEKWVVIESRKFG